MFILQIVFLMAANLIKINEHFLDVLGQTLCIFISMILKESKCISMFALNL